jgi:hypothetical protein
MEGVVIMMRIYYVHSPYNPEETHTTAFLSFEEACKYRDELEETNHTSPVITVTHLFRSSLDAPRPERDWRKDKAPRNPRG